MKFIVSLYLDRKMRGVQCPIIGAGDILGFNHDAVYLTLGHLIRYRSGSVRV